MKPLNTIEEIKTAVNAGHKVLCDGGGYEVVKSPQNQYLIHFRSSDYWIGLHGKQGTKYETTLNGTNFYIN